MTDETQINLRKLIDEAAAETYNPRAKPCGWWSHEWTMWETDRSKRYQTRRCVGCGLAERSVLAKDCTHYWITFEQIDIMREGATRRVGVAYYQRCDGCGDRRRRVAE